MLSIARILLLVVCSSLLAACGGGGGGGGSGEPNYSISVSQSSVTLNGVSGADPPRQMLTVNFRGDGLVVGTLPGQSRPGWLVVNAPTQSTSPITVEITTSAYTDAGNYSTTLRFATGKADGSHVVTTDVTVSLQMVQGLPIYADPHGVARGSSVAVALNNATPRTLVFGQQNRLGVIAINSAYTATIPTQPTGQTCTFPNEASTMSETLGASILKLRVTCNASLIPWTWVGGAKGAGGAPLYGTRGIASTSNTPGGREFAAHAADAAGNLWLFGGFGIASNGRHNDLWRYDIATGLWTWVSGSSELNASGVYGSLNQPHADNVPGGRHQAAAWVDANGDFWLFGGYGFAAAQGYIGYLNDLWKYDVDADRWIWMGGGDAVDLGALGTYGTTPSPTNIPGGRANASVIKDASGSVWIFGGNGLGAVNSFGRMNDLWRFTPSDGVWAWMSGSDQPVATGVHGTRGVPAAENYPSGRASTAGWADASGNIWIFGGSAWFGEHNDLWRFDSGTDMWTWMHGTDRTDSSVPSSMGQYDPPGTTNNNVPAARINAASWSDAAGNLWLFGGYGQTPDVHQSGRLNDLWKYTPATNTWSWLSGSSAPSSPAIYGTQGVAANTNVPSGREVGAAWKDANGRFWIYGGSPSFDVSGLVDVWRLEPQ